MSENNGYRTKQVLAVGQTWEAAGDEPRPLRRSIIALPIGPDCCRRVVYTVSPSDHGTYMPESDFLTWIDGTAARVRPFERPTESKVREALQTLCDAVVVAGASRRGKVWAWLGGVVFAAREVLRLPVVSKTPDGWRPTFRHIKRGTEYELIGTARLQTDRALADDDNMVVYRGCDGDLWVRHEAEFNNGRFAALPLPPGTETSQ